MRPRIDWPALILGVAVLAAAIWRVVAVGNYSQAVYECGTCLTGLVLLHDAPLLGALLVLLYVTGLPRIWVAAGAWALAAVVSLIYVTDVAAFAFFAMRLRLDQALAYAGDLGNVWSVVRTLLTPAVWATLVVAGLAAVLFAGRRARRRPYSSLVAVVGGLLVASGAVTSRSAGTINPWIYLNVFEVNVESGVHRAYSPEFRDRLFGSPSPVATRCASVPAARDDLILVLVESLSSYQSRAFSGLSDMTPNLDRIAGAHLSYTAFHANGPKTSSGLIASMTGRPTIPRVGQPFLAGGRPFESAEGGPPPLPAVLAGEGYWTEFLTTGDLSFENKRPWLADIGFQRVEGHDYPGYGGLDRFAFNAAPDEALYRRALDRIERLRDGTSPFFLVLLTVSSHFPFTDPESGEHSLEASIRYADRELGVFYDELVRRGLLDDGLLIVTGDHRSMTPVRRAEVERFGGSASARMPLVVAGLARSGTIDEPFQLSDLRNSIEYLLTGSACFRANEGNLFSTPPRPPTCILHHRGDEFGLVEAFCGDQEATIELDGDRTRVVRGAIPNAEELVRMINEDRIRSSYPQPEEVGADSMKDG